jgi:organic radical activating enzyme
MEQVLKDLEDLLEEAPNREIKELEEQRERLLKEKAELEEILNRTNEERSTLAQRLQEEQEEKRRAVLAVDFMKKTMHQLRST